MYFTIMTPDSTLRKKTTLSMSHELKIKQDKSGSRWSIEVEYGQKTMSSRDT